MKKVINVIHCYVSEAEQFFCWNKRGLLSKKCDKQCNICFRYEREGNPTNAKSINNNDTKN